MTQAAGQPFESNTYLEFVFRDFYVGSLLEIFNLAKKGLGREYIFKKNGNHPISARFFSYFFPFFKRVVIEISDYDFPFWCSDMLCNPK